LKIAIIEPTPYIGGIGLTDIGLIDTGKVFLSYELMKQTGNFAIYGSVAFDWLQNNDRYYKINSSNHICQPDIEVDFQSFRELLDRNTKIRVVFFTV
jgi:hypothetical protein